MASSLIGALRVTLGLDSAQFEAGSKRMRSQAARDSAAIQKSLSGVSTAFKLAFTGAVATAVGAAAKRALDYASSLGEVSQQLGVTTKDLQVYRFAATQVGISQEEMDKGLAKLTLTMGKAAAGQKGAVTTFRELGVSITDANGRVKTAGEVIPRLADAIAKIKDPATRARLEFELLGKAGQKFDPLFTQGAKGVNALANAARELGIILSDEQIQKADETADKLAAVKQVLEAKIAGVVADNAQAILGIANAITSAADAVGYFFKTMEGVKRLKRDEGWLSGMFSTPGEQATAADPKAYLQKRTRDLIAATAARRRLEGSASTGRGGNPALVAARAREQEAARLVRAAKRDLNPGPTPSFSASIPDGALPTVSGGSGGSKPKAVTAAEDLFAAFQGTRDSIDDMLPEMPSLRDAIKDSADGLGDAAINSDRFGEAMMNVDSVVGQVKTGLAEANETSDRFTRGLADGLAGAIVYGDNLGDVLVNSFKRAAAEALSSGLFDLLSGKKPGGLLGSIAGAIGAFGGGGGGLGGTGGSGVTFNDYGSTGLPGFARGGTIGGFGGIDKNLLSINGSPVARVGRGEMLRIEPNNDNGGRGVTIVQNVKYEGVGGVSEEMFVRGLSTMRQSAINGVKDAMSRRGSWR